jgi:chromosome segregation ATPase
MPAAKRNSNGATTAAAPPAKKGKKDPLQAKCAVIEAAIQRAEAAGLSCLTSTSASTLIAALPFSLGQAKDERHKFQDEAVGMINQILELYKATLETKLEECRSDIVKAEGRRDDALASAQQRQVDSDDASKKAQQLKSTLAEIARSFQAAKAGVAEAKHLAEEGGQELKMAAFRKGEVEKLQQEMENLHEAENGGRRLKDFSSRVEKYVSADSSMLTAIPCVFSKEPAARGQFDIMVAGQLVEQVQKTISNLEDMISNGAAAEAERENSVKAALATLDQDRKKQIEAANTYMQAADEARKADEAGQKAKTEITHAKRTLKEATEAETEAQVDLDVYCQEVLGTFAELQDRVAVNEDALAETTSPNEAEGLLASAPEPAVVQVC